MEPMKLPRKFMKNKVLMWRMKWRTNIAMLALALLATASAFAASARQTIQVTGYVIHAELTPSMHRLTATTQVTITALEDVTTIPLELNNALRISSITDAAGKTVDADRSSDASLRLRLVSPLDKGQNATYTFVYAGTLSGSDSSPVDGLKTASVDDPISILLYAGRWFPMTGYLTNRFTAEMHIRVPAGERVIGSGYAGTQNLPDNKVEFSYIWTKPSFPGTIIAGKFLDPVSANSASTIRVYTTDANKKSAADVAETVAKEMDYFTTQFGEAESSRLYVVELPNDTVSAYWAPEIVALAGSRFPTSTNYRLLANTVARQWWSSSVSPATLNDAWITNGMCRYGELMYMEDTVGRTAFESAASDVAAGALAYDTTPLSSTGRLDVFSPDFQSMTLEKGAMVFHMLRWEIGDDAFGKLLRTIQLQYADKGIRTADVQTLADGLNTGANLTPFFAQWLDGTGAPNFASKYTVMRLGGNKGFRTIGTISQDLDLFRMPVELRVETEGKTVTKRIEVVGSETQFVVDTFGRPRHIAIDPDNWLLKSTPDMMLRVSILRGQQLAAQGDLVGAMKEYNNALNSNRNSSLAHYRIGELYFQQHNYQGSANAYRDALNGDSNPRWTIVWSHIQLGKIFDITGQRDRAVAEYRQALQTNDNTQGALNEARKWLTQVYKPTGTTNN